jgi:DNA invertase Pin-like site-specific DNA recombinase
MGTCLASGHTEHGMNTAPLRTVAYIYLRVSTAAQVDSGLGLEAQEARCLIHCDRLGWEVAAVHRDEGISGREGVDGRPGLSSLLAALREAPDAVCVVYSVSRLARRQRLLCELLDGSTYLDGRPLPVSSATESFDTTTPMGRAMVGMISVFAQLEAEMTSERTKDALAAAKARGVRLGAPPISDTLPPEVLVRMRALRGSGASLRTIADSLNDLGIPAARGGKWHAKTVRSALA